MNYLADGVKGTIVLICAFLLFAFIGGECNGPNEEIERPYMSHKPRTTRRFSGGTLYNATIAQWERASHQNKLATAKGWLSATNKWKGHLNSSPDFGGLKLKAEMLVEGIDAAIAEMQGAYSDEEVAWLATMLINLTDDLDPYFY